MGRDTPPLLNSARAPDPIPRGGPEPNSARAPDPIPRGGPEPTGTDAEEDATAAPVRVSASRAPGPRA